MLIEYVERKDRNEQNRITTRHEMYLIKRNLIEIDGQRKITEEGTKLIAKMDYVG